MLRQRTIASEVRCTGLGLHTGCVVNLLLRPADAGAGVSFRRLDLPGSRSIPACPDSVVDTQMATTLGAGAARVGTVEHLLAALFALGIDNVEVEVDGPEVPILDGSAAPFIFLLKCAGIVEQAAYKRFLVIRRTVKVREDGRRVALRPYPQFRMDYTIEFNHPLISHQQFSFMPAEMDFRKEIARARTFGFLEDVEVMKERGLARGGSLENAVVLDRFRVLNPDGLRYPDEFVRHKILDAMGDLALLGATVVGRFEAFRSGHLLNNRLVERLMADRSAWEMHEVREPAEKGELPFLVPAWQGPSPVPAG